MLLVCAQVGIYRLEWENRRCDMMVEDLKDRIRTLQVRVVRLRHTAALLGVWLWNPSNAYLSLCHGVALLAAAQGHA